jgi:two-component system KDP operon response regulator KdpE
MMAWQQPSVLIVDDEPSLRKVLRTSLGAAGFTVEEARSGEEALEMAQNRAFDIILLDVNMPGVGGLEACRRLRNLAPRSGILMITVRDMEEDKVQGLEAGADDYITKPFHLRELIARLRAVLRRRRVPETQDLLVLQAGDLAMDLRRRVFWRSGVLVHLSPKEFDLLAFMMQNQDSPLMHARLLRSVWGPEYGNELEYLRSYVRMLRKKIEDDPSNPEYILTEPWVGYRFRNPDDQNAPANAAPNIQFVDSTVTLK